MKKKILAALLSVAMVATLFAGCGSSESASSDAAEEKEEEAAPEEEKADEEEAEAPAAAGTLEDIDAMALTK